MNWKILKRLNSISSITINRFFKDDNDFALADFANDAEFNLKLLMIAKKNSLRIRAFAAKKKHHL